MRGDVDMNLRVAVSAAVVFATVTTVAGACGTPPPSRTLAVDQQTGYATRFDQDIASGTCQSDAGYSTAQTFTAGRSGSLEQVSLLLEVPGTDTEIMDPIVVSIRELSDGRPGEVLGQGSYVGPDSSPSPLTNWVEIQLGTSVPVVSGVEYAMVFGTEACNGSTLIGANYGLPADYCAPPKSEPAPQCIDIDPAGEALHRVSNEWQPYDDEPGVPAQWDFLFRTWVR